MAGRNPRAVIAALFVLAATGGVTVAAAQSNQPRSLPTPSWQQPRLPGMPRLVTQSSSWPSSRGDSGFYPRESFDLSISGEATIACLLVADRLRDCTIVRETPPGLGFGRIALEQVQKQWRRKPRKVSGSVTGDTITFSYSISAAAYGERKVTTAVEWAHTPTGNDIRARWPAALSGVSGGYGAIRCRVEADGRLSRCRAAGQSPLRSGLTQEALKLAPEFRVALPPGGGDFAYTDVLVSIRFANPGNASEAELRAVDDQWSRPEGLPPP